MDIHFFKTEHLSLTINTKLKESVGYFRIKIGKKFKLNYGLKAYNFMLQLDIYNSVLAIQQQPPLFQNQYNSIYFWSCQDH